jgi:hypothetical protein
VIRRQVYRELPIWYFDAPVGDYYVQIIASARGGAIYLPKTMSVYRMGIAGSWSETIKGGPKKVPFLLSTLRALHAADLWLDQEFHKEFTEQMAKYLGFLNDELAWRPSPPNMVVEAKVAARRLTSWEKWARFRRHAKSFGWSRAVMFGVGHRLFLLGNRIKRFAAMTGQSTAQS